MDGNGNAARTPNIIDVGEAVDALAHTTHKLLSFASIVIRDLAQDAVDTDDDEILIECAGLLRDDAEKLAALAERLAAAATRAAK